MLAVAGAIVLAGVVLFAARVALEMDKPGCAIGIVVVFLALAASQCGG